MPQQKLSFKNSVITYYKYGNGSKILFCLHGYGEDGTSFSFLEKYLGETYTLYAIDFPFHGATDWNEEVLSSDGLLYIFNSISNNTNNLFSVLAYSMGGRAALYLLQHIPEKIERVVLIAPDGLHENFWYFLSTQTKPGNKLFAYTMQKPQLFFSFLNAAGKTNIVNKSIVKFVHHFLDDANERTLLYKRWSVMHVFRPNLADIKNLCNKKDIQLHLLFGSFDRIILHKRAAIFKQSKNIHINIIEAGHQLLKEKYASSIVPLLNG
jgi:pimeloyl-ACP methyl ester carboxylesterase